MRVGSGIRRDAIASQSPQHTTDSERGRRSMLPAHSCAKFWCIRALKGPAPPCSAVPAAGVHRMRSCRRSCRIWLAAALHSSGREQTPLRRRRTHVYSHPHCHNRMVVIVWSATAFSCGMQSLALAHCSAHVFPELQQFVCRRFRVHRRSPLAREECRESWRRV